MKSGKDIRFCTAPTFINDMSTPLAEALQSVTADEIKLALDKIRQYSPRDRQDVYQAHASRIRRTYKGFSRLLNLEADREIEVLSPGKIDGYRFAASLIVVTAESRKSDDLKNALLDIDPEEVMKIFCQIIEGEPDALIADQIASRGHFPGFCGGVSLAFSFLTDGGEQLEQMSIGLTIFAGILLKLAAASDAAASPAPSEH